MSGFSDCAYLVRMTYTATENGRSEPHVSRKRVYVNPFTLSASAYEVADAEGFRLRHVLQVRACDYDGEDAVEYHGDRLYITDVQGTGRGEYVRISCSEKVADDEH